jgi:preprotein translocase subunit SecG
MTRMGTLNSSATFRACILQPAFFGVQLQKTLVKWTAVMSIPWSIISFTARVLSRPPESKATAFRFKDIRFLPQTFQSGRRTAS